ncbi:hypothetical protein IEQ34_020636 [Dendrobium chrysotoxum]|uniref:Uncharacterized protein n=1 Tax=Dendrobium chrysotoxum TaxID=161865 RepID=A0AAV7G2V8_DENCH|nr:hypothetical protein IEQ34_020636 [Dendrobium chrysotoxum]
MPSIPRSLTYRPLMFRRYITVIGSWRWHRSGCRSSGVVFERGASVGGTWVYTPAIDPERFGLDSNRKVVHSILYDGLRTNLPRECMGFSNYAFVTVTGNSNDDLRRLPRHHAVLR